MKKRICFLQIILLASLLTSCIDREIIDAKDGISLPAVSELRSSLNGDEVNIQWSNPSQIPDLIRRPHSVYIQVYKGSTLEYQIALGDEPTSWTYTLAEPELKYRVIVKTLGWLKEKPYGESDEIYSLGQTIAVN
ncbi:MAG: DUF4945 domain-containing protein [Tannerellaceae bacterium]|jgi:hypothetical protein|nr:DUF4945 domain-containing protein [Tannerellaceae bacterium]